MLIEISTKTIETEKGYYKGDVTVAARGKGGLRQSFSFTISDIGTDKQQLIVRRQDHILINLRGQIHDEAPLLTLTEIQITLLKLIAPSVITTVQNIRDGREGSQGAADEAARLWCQFGLSFEIAAEYQHYMTIIDPVEQSSVLQLFEDDQ